MNRIKIWYTNWRGETSIRTITPLKIRYGTSEWHKEKQWLIIAFDHDKQEEREFAMKDFGEEVEHDMEW